MLRCSPTAGAAENSLHSASTGHLLSGSPSPAPQIPTKQLRYMRSSSFKGRPSHFCLICFRPSPPLGPSTHLPTAQPFPLLQEHTGQATSMRAAGHWHRHLLLKPAPTDSHQLQWHAHTMELLPGKTGLDCKQKAKPYIADIYNCTISPLV